MGPLGKKDSGLPPSLLFSGASVASESVLEANAPKMWLSDNPDSFFEEDGDGDFSSIVSLSADPLQLFRFDFPLSGFSPEVEHVFRLFDNSALCCATGDGGGVGSILRLLGSAGRESKGLVAGGEPFSLRPSLVLRLVRVVSPGTDGSLRLAFGLPPGETVGLRELISDE